MHNGSYTDEQERRDVRAARRGDREALGRLYDCLFPRLYAYVVGRVETRQDAEDIVAETWLRAVRKLSQFEGKRPGSFSGWIFQIARRLIADHYRDAYGADVLPQETLDHQQGWRPLPPHLLEQNEQRSRIRNAINVLSPRRREVILLRYFAGLRNKEIAEVLGLDERTVASNLSRALADLSERLVEEMEQ